MLQSIFICLLLIAAWTQDAIIGQHPAIKYLSLVQFYFETNRQTAVSKHECHINRALVSIDLLNIVIAVCSFQSFGIGTSCVSILCAISILHQIARCAAVETAS